ncbi:MAG: hypothetical protein EPO21_24360 [Chloroflexota bacterium]|nr:MAG: hypothetical protein EPO21_24360 [Chloroflexota bacterium]
MTDGQIWQLIRIVGKGEFLSCLSLQSEEELRSIGPDQLTCIQDLSRRNARKITRLLVHEAIGQDSIQTSAQAEQYLEQRLAFFGDLIPNDVKDQIRENFGTLTAMWGS